MERGIVRRCSGRETTRSGDENDACFSDPRQRRRRFASGIVCDHPVRGAVARARMATTG